MQVKVIWGMLEDDDVEDSINDALAEGWILRDTHVAVPEPGRTDYVGIWLVAVMIHNNDQDQTGQDEQERSDS